MLISRDWLRALLEYIGGNSHLPKSQKKTHNTTTSTSTNPTNVLHLPKMSERRRPSFSKLPRSRSHSHSRSHSRSRPSLSRSGSRNNDSHHLTLSPYHFSSHPQYYGEPEPNEKSSGSFEVPTINASLDHTLPQEYFKAEILNVIKALRISKWHRLPHTVANDIQLKRMSGALTNAIYRIDAPSIVILKNHNLHNFVFPSLLLRIYGQNADSFIDRSYELKVLSKLSRKNIGPKLLGIFKNGRLEQFLENAITLTKKDIMDLKTSARIARRMKELHIGILLSTKEKERGPMVIKSVKEWLSRVEEWVESDNFNYKSVNELILFKMKFSKFKENALKYINWISAKYDPSRYKELVFCHNDTQYGNLLFSTSSPIRPPPPPPPLEKPSSATSQTSLVTNFSNLSIENIPEQLNPTSHEKKQDQNLVVIDFEYSSPNFPGFDIANHFSEWMHNYNHPTRSYSITISDFPSIEEQLNFNYSYVLFRNPEFIDITKANSQNLKVLESQSKLLYNQVLDWRPAVSLFWSLWAILQNGPKDDDSNNNIIEVGLNGEKYKVVIDEDDYSSDSDQEYDEGVEGTADNENFEYLLYAKEKIEVMFGDLVQLGIVEKEDVDESVRDDLRYLNVQYFDV